jgi:ADP-L-glycero-D-manno-heptose 6-epimerase
MNVKNILITGGGGFIGSNIAMYFQQNFPNYNVTIFDKFDNCTKFENGNKQFLGSYKNLLLFKGQIICGDICDQSDLTILLKTKWDVIFHLAAISDTRVSNQNLIYRNNINSFYGIIEIAQRSGARLVYASSAAVYGNKANRKLNFGDEKPDNPYAFSKYSMDCICRNFLKESNRNKIIGLRYFNVYGFGEAEKGSTASTIFQFTQQILSGKNPTLFNGSSAIFRDFVYIKDVVQATVNAGFLDVNGVYNVGSGNSRSFLDVLSIVQNVLGTEKEVNYIDNPFTEGYQYFTEANIDQTMLDLNYSPVYSLEQGVAEYLLDLSYFKR